MPDADIKRLLKGRYNKKGNVGKICVLFFFPSTVIQVYCKDCTARSLVFFWTSKQRQLFVSKNIKNDTHEIKSTYIGLCSG